MKLLSKQEVAAIVGIHPESVMRLVREGKFPRALKLGNEASRVRFDEADVERWIEQRKLAAEQEAAL